jgi:hypothetical protein
MFPLGSTPKPNPGRRWDVCVAVSHRLPRQLDSRGKEEWETNKLPLGLHRLLWILSGGDIEKVVAKNLLFHESRETVG